MLRIPAATPQPDRLALSGEVSGRVQAALGGLTPQERIAFVLRHFEGQSIEEIGSALGLNTNATKNSIFRAVQKLRRELEPLVSPVR
jgi:RNA polymerase sigma-70 factor (ECF subfamily)